MGAEAATSLLIVRAARKRYRIQKFACFVVEQQGLKSDPGIIEAIHEISPSSNLCELLHWGGL